MTEHPLDPLLQPASIALLGASERSGSPGRVLAEMVIESDYSGSVYPVNPGYEQILGMACYANLAALPQTVEHVVIALGNAQLENALATVIEHGAKAATIYSSGVLPGDTEPALKQRLADLARNAGLHICGINGMGFYNIEQQLYAGIFPRAAHINQGGISYIAQSGSAFYHPVPQRLPTRIQPLRLRRRRDDHRRRRLHGLVPGARRYARDRPVPGNRARSARFRRRAAKGS